MVSSIKPRSMTPIPNSGPKPLLAYLISQYPAISHTFILRELHHLRELGFFIPTASIRTAVPSATGFLEAEQKEYASTFYVKARGPLRIGYDHLVCFLRQPLAYLRGLRTALRFAHLDLKALAYHLLYFAEAVTIGEWMRRNSIPHLHVHFANAAATAALLLKQTHGIPYSLTVHGPDEFYDTEMYHLREKIEGAAFICCISRFCRSQLMKVSSPMHWGKMQVCALGVDPDVFTPRLPPMRQDSFKLLCVGRLCAAKGQAILLAAVSKLVERGRNVRLDLLGDGPDRQVLEDQVAGMRLEKIVVFHGAVNQEYVCKLLKINHLFVLPSFAEGVPVSLMEAMAMEIPVVSTTIAGIPELIESGTEGILVPPSDPTLLADAIEKLMDNPELRQRLAAGGRRKVLQAYNQPRNVHRLAEIFQQQLQGSHSQDPWWGSLR